MVKVKALLVAFPLCLVVFALQVPAEFWNLAPF